MGYGMRVLTFVTVAMGVLILLGTAGLVAALVLRHPPATPAAPASLALVLDEPPESRIVGVAAVQDRLAVALSGGGADRVLLLDPRTGTIAGRIALRR
jgi:Family of unknown function (DUF6476)